LAALNERHTQVNSHRPNIEDPQVNVFSNNNAPA
jgi:hypothetical protein